MKEVSLNKKAGKVYSPDYVVNKILDEVGYNNEGVLKKSIIDTSCGDGAFLKEIVRRIIKFSKPEELRENLSFVYGWDIDINAIISCKETLNKEIEHLNIGAIDWNVFHIDSLKVISNINSEKKFDFIVGNPPYVRIHNISDEDRAYLRGNYAFCKNGSTDMYIAFFELSFKLLNTDGICGLITPNSFFYTENSKELRKTFVENRSVKKIINFLSSKVFEDVSTYTAITIFTKNQNSSVVYEELQENGTFESKTFNNDYFSGSDSWKLTIKDFKIGKGVELKSIAKIQVGIATLCDKAFVFDVENIDGEFCYALTKLKGKIKIENAILKNIIKASRLKEGEIKTQKILFPYKKGIKKFEIIDENELKTTYPFAYEYLLSIKEELDKRDKGKPNMVSWYAFGRSQGLDSSFGNKILFSPMNIKPNFIYVEDKNNDTTFYSGYCIKYNGDYQKLLKEINSDKMEEYISVSNRSFGSGWKSYSKKVVEKFRVDFVDR